MIFFFLELRVTMDPLFAFDVEFFRTQFVSLQNCSDDAQHDITRTRWMVYRHYKRNPFLFNFAYLMPLYANVVLSNQHQYKACMSSKAIYENEFTPNFLYMLVYKNEEYQHLLSDTKLHNGLSVRLSSTLVFADVTFGETTVCEMTNKQVEKTLPGRRFVQYRDLSGIKHKIYLPLLITRVQYFARRHFSAYCDKLVTGAKLNFNPTEIASCLQLTHKQIALTATSYLDHQIINNLLITAEALEAVLLYCNCGGKIEYNGTLTAYIAACVYLQSDFALQYLMLSCQLTIDTWLDTVQSFANNIGVTHPVFEFLILFGSSNLFSISFHHLLRIIVSPINCCHYLCVHNRPQMYSFVKKDRCVFAMICNEGKNYVEAVKDRKQGLIWLKEMDNECKPRTQSFCLLNSERYYNSSLAFIMDAFKKQMTVFYEVFVSQSICELCGNGEFQTRFPKESMWITLRCCRKKMHRLCYHKLFDNMTEWYCTGTYCKMIHIGGKYIVKNMGYLLNGSGSYGRELITPYYIGYGHPMQNNVHIKEIIYKKPRISLHKMI